MINSQNRNKIFLLVIAIMLLANIVLLTFFLMKNDERHFDKRPDRKMMIAEFLKKEIGFTREQLQQYDTLSTQHQENVKKMFENHRVSKDMQFEQLTRGNFSDSIMNLVADQSAASQKTMELQMFNHLKNIRMLCTKEQMPKFDSLFVKILNRRGGDNKRKPAN